MKSKKVFLSLFLLILTFLAFSKTVKAEGLSNKVGIHILNSEEVLKAKELVNSNGGDWGYVTIVIRDDEMVAQKWQNFFDNCREFHLIPLVRIATHMRDNFWVKPQESDIQKWADFLGNLNWPVKNRYLIIFNEPNHEKEWGGEINAREYAHILLKSVEVFKSKSANFQIINAGFDLSAPNSPNTVDALEFLSQMNKEIPGIFQKLDGWASHSYPNHGFIGTPYQQGRTSIRGYQWELWILKNHFKLEKDLPVFITETGWPYKIGKQEIYFREDKAAEFIGYAFENIWLPDKRVFAVTPFVLFYPQFPFENFSWITKENQETLPFQKLKSIKKVTWVPEQEFRFKFEKIFLPPFLPTRTEFKGIVSLRNNGQSIWGERDLLKFPLTKGSESLKISDLQLPNDLKVKPGEKVDLSFCLRSSSSSGEFTFSWNNLSDFKIRVVPASTLTQARYTLWQKINILLGKILRF